MVVGRTGGIHELFLCGCAPQRLALLDSTQLESRVYRVP